MKRTVSAILAVLTLICLTSCFGTSQKEGALTASITVDVTKVAVGLDEAIPHENGYILKDSEMKFNDGDNLFDAFVDVMQAHKLQFEASDGYVTAISNIYAGDFGELSGWCYYVNGEIPSVGSREIILKEGDKVEFIYFVDYNEAFN